MRQILLSRIAGTVAGFLDLGLLLSSAALIFSGRLTGFVANGIGLLLVGTCLMNVGELGFSLGRCRTAAVIADEPRNMYRITRDALRRLDAENPAAASTFHLIIARLLSERAIHLIDTVDALQR